MRTVALPFLFAALLSGSALAQATWQPTQPPLVTAENTRWFQTGEPIVWNGDFYYPAGAAQGFNAYQMVRSGSFRGIPLYSDATLEPYSIVFVPIAGGRMQPYERRRTGDLAGTTGSRAPSLPTDFGVEGSVNASIAQALAPPTYARAYDLAPLEEAPPQAVGTSGRMEPETIREYVPPAGPVTSAIPPTGENAIWVNFAGKRWYAAGRSIAYDASELNEIGRYQGWTVYTRHGDPDGTIYISSRPGRLAAYAAR
jgi:hypothetical protein